MGKLKKRAKEVIEIAGRIGLGLFLVKLTWDDWDQRKAQEKRRGGTGVDGREEDGIVANQEELAKIVLKKCEGQGCQIAVAESCTGGLLGGALSAIPGSSKTFRGGVISYQNEIKAGLLGVDKDDLDQIGPVSETVACQMAIRAARACDAQIGVSITGFAGPATAEQPSGEVWIAVAREGKVNSKSVKQWQFEGDRQAVREQAVWAALWMTRQELNRKAK